MKKNISKILIILFLLNALVPLSTFASEPMTLYNRDEVVPLSTDLQQYNDKLYLSLSDLRALSISSNFWSPTLSMYNNYNNVSVYLESSIVLLNNKKILYQNPLILINSKPYVSLDLVAMVFSSIYEVDTQMNTIHLWTKAPFTETISGVIKLPNGDKAPQGGISLEVFYGTPTFTYSGGNSGSSVPIIVTSLDFAGYLPKNKPVIPTSETTMNYFYSFQKTVYIPEGSNSVKFILDASNENLDETTVIGYTIHSAGYNETYTVPYYDDIDSFFQFTIKDKFTNSISGSVVLPQAAEETIGYTVYTYNGGNTYMVKGTIDAGKTTSDYLFHVKGNETYTVSIAFDNGRYLRADYNDSVFVADNSNTSAVNFTAVPSNQVKGILSLPAGFVPTGDIKANVTLQSAHDPYYYLDTQEVTIPYGKTSAPFELPDDMNTSEVIVFYELMGEVDGLYSYGHFSGVGTSSRVEYADILTFDGNEIQMPLLKTKQLSVTAKLPNNELADADIYGSIYAVPTFNKNTSSRTNFYVSVSNTEDSEQQEDELLELFQNAKNFSEIDNLIVENADLLNIKEYTVLSSSQRVDVAKKIATSAYSSIDDLIAIMNQEIKAVQNSSSSGGTGSSSGGVDGGGGGGGTIHPPVVVPSVPLLIEKKANSGAAMVTIIEEYGITYYVYLTNISGSEHYYNKVYYKQDSSTVLEGNSTSIDAATDNIEVTLMRQNIVSGSIETNVEDSNFSIYAIYQDNPSIKKDIYNTMFVSTSYYTDNNHDFKIMVPTELEDYIFAINRNNQGFIYYSQAEMQENSADADVIKVTNNLNNINFVYEAIDPPTPLSIDSIRHDSYGSYWEILIVNISDFKKENTTINTCFYDDNGCLQQTISAKQNLDSGYTYLEFPWEFNSAYNKATTAKIFLWDENMQPLSYPYSVKHKKDDDAMQKAHIAFQIGNPTMYMDGKELVIDVAPVLSSGQMLAPIRASAEALGLYVTWNEAEQSIQCKSDQTMLTLYLNQTIAILNGEEITLTTLPKIVDGRTLIPIYDIAKRFGYLVDWYPVSGILKIN